MHPTARTSSFPQEAQPDRFVAPVTLAELDAHERAFFARLDAYLAAPLPAAPSGRSEPPPPFAGSL